MNVLFVCRGNLCRSPMAGALLKKKFADNRLNGEVDSAGFESFHINEPPHDRARQVAAGHGVELKGKARMFTRNDFIRFDRIYVMDTLSYHDVTELADSPEEMAKVDYFRNMETPGKNEIVPDPVHSGVADCESVYELLDRLTTLLVTDIMKEDAR